MEGLGGWVGVPCKLNNSSSRVVSQTSYKRRQQTSSSDVPTTSSGVHDSTSSRRLNMTSLGPLHDVLTTSSRRRISCRALYFRFAVHRSSGFIFAARLLLLLLLIVYRPSSAVYRHLFVYRHPFVFFGPSSDRSAALPTSTQRFARQPDRASSSSVVSQAVHRAVVCWSKEDNSSPSTLGSKYH